MQAVHGWSEQKLIILNELDQPIGPTKEVVTEFGSFLGTLARNGTFCPLNVLSWKKLKTHDNMWNYIKEKNKKNPDELSNKEFFEATRRRKPGRVYKDSSKDTANKIVEMERVETQQSEDSSQSGDTFTTVMGPDHPGRVRLYGLGVTKNRLKQKVGDTGSSSNIVDELVGKRLDELEERIQQRMQEKFNAQKDSIERDVTMNIITHLQRLNPGLTLDPDMLIFSVRSSEEEAADQPINRPSAGSNNQGVENEERDEDSDEDLDLT